MDFSTAVTSALMVRASLRALFDPLRLVFGGLTFGPFLG